MPRAASRAGRLRSFFLDSELPLFSRSPTGVWGPGEEDYGKDERRPCASAYAARVYELEVTDCDLKRLPESSQPRPKRRRRLYCSHGEKPAACNDPARADRASHRGAARPARHARFRPGPALRRVDQGAQPSRQAQPRSLPDRFRVSAYAARVYKLEVTNCDFKFRGIWRSAQTALGLHRTRRRHAVQRPPFAHGGAGQRRDHAGLRPAAAAAGDAR